MSATANAPRTDQPFTRADLGNGTARILNKGRWANATVFVHEHAGVKWVVKDFHDCPVPYRETLGRLMVSRELSALERLRGLSGVPADTFRIDAYALAYRFVPGIEMADAGPERATPDFFRALEAVVLSMHRRNIVHLDLRYGGNILVSDADEPLLVDFQSHVKLRGLPRFVKRLLVSVDLAGVYKHWSHRHPDSLGAERLAFLGRANSWRKLWVLKGYFGFKPQHHKNRPPGDA
ncbi:MAG: hypothetical protein LJE97_08190 [Betaproteobacteria bacterium]|jgi:hypothetical protein|nr:hypothetical protein [Betaproteobacteria bacterium]